MGNCIYPPPPKKPSRVLPETPSEGDYFNDERNGSTQKIVIALYSFDARDVGELSFEKGERLIVIDDKEPDWWLAKKVNQQKTGYIPRNFVTNIDRKYVVIETEEWFFSKLSRSEAEKLLLQKDNPKGTFLIRNSHTEIDAFSLSVKNIDAVKFEHVVHYKIRKKPDGQYFITSWISFPTLQELVGHYSNSSDMLCTRLVKACPMSENKSVGLKCGEEINRNDLRKYHELGSGNFGKVYYGVFKGEIEVAIKTLTPGSMSPKAFLQEAAIMRKYRHNNIVPLYGVCSLDQPLLIVTEYMNNGSLLDYLRDNPEGQSSTLIELIVMASQVASGMAYLESWQVIHRDLAARNVLVGENKVVKVADFGLARIIEEEYIASLYASFPIKWTAPEAATKRKYSTKSDVWSFGILLYELITKGDIPYPGMSNADVLQHVKRGYRMPQPEDCDCPDTIYQIMLECWHKDPAKRPTFEYLQSHFDARLGESYEDFEEDVQVDVEVDAEVDVGVYIKVDVEEDSEEDFYINSSIN